MIATRRRFLTRAFGAAGAAALSPFVPILSREARGQVAAPTRLVVFATFNGVSGVYPDRWRPVGPAGPLALAPDSILSPLAPHVDRLLVMQGLHNFAMRDTHLPGGHPIGLGTLLTGGALVSGDGMQGGGARTWRARTVGPSIDQLIAQRLGAGSIEAGVAVGGVEDFKHRISFANAQQPLPPEDNPAVLWRRLFSGLGLGDQELALLRDRRQSVLDVVRADLRRLESELVADERYKMEAHLEALRAMELRVQQLTEQPVCTPPEEQGVPNHLRQEKVPAVGDAHMRMIVGAFACGIARVATIMWGSAPHGWTFPWLPQPLSAPVHSLSHEGSSNAAAQDELVRAGQWYAGQLAKLLDMLAAIPEGDGTMLDNTAVLWTTENGRSNTHSFRNLPFVIAGSCGGYFPTGVLRTFPELPHNHLLVSLCHAMGLEDVTVFGTADYGSGPLSWS